MADGAAAGLEGVSQTLRESQVKGGLCVIVGNCDMQFAEEIARDNPYLVHCLSDDEAKVGAAREALLDPKLKRLVSIENWRGPGLPYADNLVSLLFVLEDVKTTRAELLRVLRPGGELVVKQGDRFMLTTKPRPKEMDDWTHWRHGADRNPVSKDSLVDVPQGIQWILSSTAIGERAHFLCANGRAFSQDKEVLTARDAFNGMPLWRAKLKKGAEFNWEYSVKVAALVVAKGDRVYCLTDDGKFKALDAATGRPAIVYEEAGVPYDIVVVDDGQSKLGTIVVSCPDAVRAIDAETGRLLWKDEAAQTDNLIASSYATFYIKGNDRHGDSQGEIVGRELLSGKLMWKKAYDWARRTELGSFGYDRIVYEMRSPNDWKEFYKKYPQQQAQDKFALAVISAKTGEEIQRVRGTGSSARHGEFRAGFWYKDHLVTEAQSREGLNLVMFGLDNFAEPSDTFKANYLGDRGWGHCYPPVLTERFYLNGQLNFTDMQTRKQVSNQITRGACNTARPGYIPANGLIYTFPKHCICFPMLDGSVALAPAAANRPEESTDLVKGPAWPARPVAADYSREWPTFRNDEYRSGGTGVTVPANLKVAWTTEIKGPDYTNGRLSEWISNPSLAGPITAPVIAGGLVYVAQSDTHRLLALDAQTGQERWEFTADGRIDGPPTVHRGQCLVGCRSGWVYNIRGADGQMIWKLRVAPNERRISAYGQVESPWPVAGGVLMVKDLAYVAAGIHPNADGGIRVLCVEPETGRIVWQNKFADLGFNDPWPDPYDPRKTRPESNLWRTIRPLDYRYFDLPVRDGDSVAVSRCCFDLKTGRKNLQKTSGFYHATEAGVYMPRSAWRYDTERIGTPVAVFHGSSVFSTLPEQSKLFRVDFAQGASFNPDWVSVSLEDEKAGAIHAVNKIFALGTRWTSASADTKTSVNRAMLVAGEHLFTVTPKGLLTVHRVEDGRAVGEIKLDLPAWGGLAAANGRLYVSTTSGKIICLARN
jgi:outer membrane protein assembly factor BamB